MTAADLLALADRCEKESSSWDLDVNIECMLDGRDPPTEVFAAYQPTPYTSSIDAALTIALPWMEYRIETLYGPCAVEMPLNCNDETQSARREDGNVPMTICAAALRARAAEIKVAVEIPGIDK
jgi:hypothetical protein